MRSYAHTVVVRQPNCARLDRSSADCRPCSSFFLSFFLTAVIHVGMSKSTAGPDERGAFRSEKDRGLISDHRKFFLHARPWRRGISEIAAD